jgi:hypothetical protein
MTHTIKYDNLHTDRLNRSSRVALYNHTSEVLYMTVSLQVDQGAQPTATCSVLEMLAN